MVVITQHLPVSTLLLHLLLLMLLLIILELLLLVKLLVELKLVLLELGHRLGVMLLRRVDLAR